MPDKYGMPTDTLSPKQAAERADSLTEQAKRLREYSAHIEMGEVSPNANPKSVSRSKLIINASFIIFGIAGIIGSFWDKFDMVKYTNFLSVFAYIWAPLVVSVGGGRAFKNFVTKKYGNQQ